MVAFAENFKILKTFRLLLSGVRTCKKEEIKGKPRKNERPWKNCLVVTLHPIDNLLLHKAIPFFEAAINEDSLFSSAYADLAYTYCRMVFWDYMEESEGFLKAKFYANKALKLNSSESNAYVVLALHEIFFNYNFESIVD